MRIVDAPVEKLSKAVREKDWKAARPALYPYLHWTDPDGTVIRGRNNVLARRTAGPTPSPPRSVELRDGQIYRWTC
jgi:hypothetical protein